MFFLIFHNCQTHKNLIPSNSKYDFFYGDNYIQIIGKGNVQENFNSYEEKLKHCVKLAKVHADSKWLAVTVKYKESSWLWHDRLQQNYYSFWKSCLDDAKIIQVIPIFPDKCNIIVHYYCDPQKW